MFAALYILIIVCFKIIFALIKWGTLNETIRNINVYVIEQIQHKIIILCYLWIANMVQCFSSNNFILKNLTLTDNQVEKFILFVINIYFHLKFNFFCEYKTRTRLESNYFADSIEFSYKSIIIVDLLRVNLKK